MGLRETLKRWLIFNVLFDTRAIKLAGINDFANIFTGIVTFDVTTNSIVFPTLPPGPCGTYLPNWVIPDKYIRITSGGGLNSGRLYKVKRIYGHSAEIVETLLPFSGSTTLDGRLWVIINNPDIARSTSTGSTMYNVHNRDTTSNPGDASEIGLTFAEHYHEKKIDDQEGENGEIVTHEYNEAGGISLAADACTGWKVPIGPLVVVDCLGNVVYTSKKVNDPVDRCFPLPIDMPHDPGCLPCGR